MWVNLCSAKIHFFLLKNNKNREYYFNKKTASDAVRHETVYQYACYAIFTLYNQ